MKTRILYGHLILFYMTTLTSLGQGLPAEANSEHDANHPCISEAEYALMEKRCNENAVIFNLSGAHKRAAVSVPLSWPLKSAAALNDCGFYHVSAYVDQNTTSGVFQDFNCGTNSYDGHTGTDISIWPFNFYKMDNNFVEVIAAAPGTIVDKHDGEFDRNCAANNLTANYVVIEHSDGSRALYWHMKKSSLTAKAIGQTVFVGEFLGIVGSSGSSSGPHLHFEVWAGNTKATRVDPFSGTCNTLNPSSWWAAQKPYKEIAVVRATVHTTDIVIPACPATETLNESNSFTIPFQGAGLSPGYAKFYMFLRDETNGLTADLSILNPDNSVNTSWTYTSTADHKTLMWGFSKKLPTIPGKYTFKVTYNNTTCSSKFDIVSATGIAANQTDRAIKVYPNPFSEQTVISFNNPKAGTINISLFDITGREISVLIKNEQINEGFHQFVLHSKGLPDGVYFCEIISGEIKTTQKLVIQH